MPPPAVRRGPAPPPQMRQRPPQRKRRRRSGGLLTAILYAVAFLVLVLGGGAAYLILNPPSDLIRETLAQQVKEKTGRDLVVAGPAAFSFYPGLGVTLKDVSLSGPAGSPAVLVKMAELDINIKTMPLLNRQVEVRRLILRKPVFDLRVDKKGAKNWTFAQAAGPLRYAQASPGAAGAATATDAPQVAPRTPGIRLPTKLSEVEHLALDDVRIEQGTIRYTDERSGKTQALDAINMAINLKSLSSALTADGDFSWKGEKTAFSGKVSPVRYVLEEKPARLIFNASNRHLASSYDGALHVSDGADLEGKITAKSESLRQLAGWLGTPLPAVSGLRTFSLAGDLKTDGNVTSLSNATLALDGATAKGNTTVVTGGVRPKVKASLTISELDLNKYLAGAAGARNAPDPAKAAPADARGTAAGDAIEELLNKPATGPRVQAYQQRDGWSGVPLDLSMFAIADLDAKLKVGRLFFQDIKVGQSALGIDLKDKVLKTSFDNIQLYEGAGQGFLNVDATQKAARIGANFTLSGLSALPFLRDAADMDWLSGKAQVALQLASSGQSQLQLVESLNGKANFTFADGAIVGFNVPGAIRGLNQGSISGLRKTPSEKTDFSELSASFKITNGVAQNQDLRLTSPLLRVTGAGAVQMPQRTLDYTVRPKLVASLEGQKGKTDLSGLEIPIRITGPWSKPRYEPDLKSVLADPNKVVDTVKQIGKQLKGKDAKKVVEDLLDSQGATGSTTKEKAKSLLDKFLKQP